jgi:hypothetical protein
MLRTSTIVSALIAIALAGSAWGQSPQGSPEPPTGQASPPDQSTASTQRGTEESPFIIKLLPSQNTESVATSEANKEKKETPAERAIAEFTQKLYYATLALAVIAAFQFGVFIAQCIQFSRTVEHMRISERPYVYGGFGGRRVDNNLVIHPNWVTGKRPPL